MGKTYKTSDVFRKFLKNENEDNQIGKIYKRMILPMLILNLLFFLISLFWGFDLKNLVGFFVGFIYMLWCYAYLGITINRAVEQGEKKAKRTMMSCYMIRYVGMFVICLIGFELKWYSVVCAIIPQFYPKMVLSLDSLTGNKYFTKE